MLLGHSTYSMHTGQKSLQDIQATCGKDNLMWPTAHTTEVTQNYPQMSEDVRIWNSNKGVLRMSKMDACKHNLWVCNHHADNTVLAQ